MLKIGYVRGKLRRTST